MQIQPYLFFEGRCDEAIEFYRSAVGAEVSMLMRFKEAPPSDQGMMAPGTGDKVMHAAVKIGDSTVLMSDGRCGGSTAFAGFSLSLSVDGEPRRRRRSMRCRKVERLACRWERPSSRHSSECSRTDLA